MLIICLESILLDVYIYEPIYLVRKYITTEDYIHAMFLLHRGCMVVLQKVDIY